MTKLDQLVAGLSDGIHRLRMDDGRRVLVKVRRTAPADFFAAEARGLEALAAARALRVPDVRELSREAIALEDLGSGQPLLAQWRDAGRRLAQLHAAKVATFGFSGPGYCGDSPQDNTSSDDGFAFFHERRLLPQARRARDAGLLEPHLVRRVEALGARLRELLPERPPVLIHGDLWNGNLHACAGGELALIDGGAVHYGWAECDLAMLTLFGEPPPAFFAAYETAAGIARDWRERAPLLNLYHLLNHLNLFGAGYRGGVLAILERFA